MNTRYSQWQYRGDISAILPLTITCIHFRCIVRRTLTILVNGTCRGDSVAQACKSRIGLAACVRYAYACISRDTAVWLNLAKQHHSAWTSFSSILTKMIWIYQHFGGAVSFDWNIGEASNLKCIILITLFIQISNKMVKNDPKLKIEKSFRHPTHKSMQWRVGWQLVTFFYPHRQVAKCAHGGCDTRSQRSPVKNCHCAWKCCGQLFLQFLAHIIAATGSRMLEYPHGWQLLGYDFSYPNIRPQKKKIVQDDAYLCQGERRPLAWYRRKKCFPTQALPNSPLRNWDQMSRFLFGLGGQWIILPSLVFKTTLFNIIIIKSAPWTATRSKIACVFSWGTAPVVWWWQKRKKEEQKIKKFKKIQKNYKKTWRPNIWVFACKPGSFLGYLITLLCTALAHIKFKNIVSVIKSCRVPSIRSLKGKSLIFWILTSFICNLPIKRKENHSSNRIL